MIFLQKRGGTAGPFLPGLLPSFAMNESCACACVVVVSIRCAVTCCLLLASLLPFASLAASFTCEANLLEDVNSQKNVKAQSS